MTLFLAAVDEGSLAAAARRQGRSPASLTRAVTLLERQAGETLLLRTTRRLGLTAAGERYVAVWRDVLARLTEVDGEPDRAPLHGTFVLTAPELFGRLMVMPLIETFVAQHSRTAARVLLVNRIVDLIGEGIDLAVRLAPLPDSTLSTIRVGQVRTLVCATPAYLDRAGAPALPADLASHDCIGLNAGANGDLWRFAAGPGREEQVRSLHVRTRISVNSAASAIDAALRGAGIVQVRSYQVENALEAGRLVRLMPEYEPPATPVQLVFPTDRGRTGALRAFLDYAVPALRRSLRSDIAGLSSSDNAR